MPRSLDNFKKNKKNKMNNFKILFIALAAIAISFSACKKDPVIEEPVELITTLNYTLVPTAGGAAVTLSFQDTDGDGGMNPIYAVGTLAANTTYSGSIELLDESGDDVENVTKEIEEEDEEHQFFFDATGGISIAYADMDEDGNPIGLANTLTTGAAGNSALTVILRHEPDKDASGVSDGDISNAGGETDIEVTFNVTVQ